MLMNDPDKHDEICNTVVQKLRVLGVKYRSKKAQKKIQDARLSTTQVFKKPLHLLQHVTVELSDGIKVQVPTLVHELCSYISNGLETEGLFRKAGSTARQKEIKLLLDAGCELSSEHHVIDVGNVLKLFFRELPEPLIPYTYHELFLQCLLAKKGEINQAILLACLLLPALHRSTLTYFMQFLQRVAICSKFNKMDVKNVAIVMTPTVMPIEDKVISYKAQRISHHVQVVQVLIENSSQIGIVPKSIADTIFSSQTSIECSNEVNTERKKKKRRSTSLTRMINGFKKIVGAKSVDEPAKKELVTPDLLLTPCLTRSTKKRKGGLTAGFSNKRRRELLDSLPQGSALASTPFQAVVTPVCHHPKPEDVPTPTETAQHKPTHSDTEFLCIPKSEYEEIKSRVSAIEDRITQEFNAQPMAMSSQVQAVYEKTLEEVGSMSPTTEQLARRLSRELKIRRSSEHKVIRSPSARKIGSIRRRSQEGVAKVTRNQSCHIPRAALKRGRPNTVTTGLPQPSPASAEVGRSSSFNSHTPMTRKALEKWNSAEMFFKAADPKHAMSGEPARDSLVKLRTQNAGMVLAKAKLFNELSDSNESIDKRLRSSGTFPRQNPVLKRQRAFDLTEKENKSYEHRDNRKHGRSRSPKKQLESRRMSGSKSPKKNHYASIRVHIP